MPPTWFGSTPRHQAYCSQARLPRRRCRAAELSLQKGFTHFRLEQAAIVQGSELAGVYSSASVSGRRGYLTASGLATPIYTPTASVAVTVLMLKAEAPRARRVRCDPSATRGKGMNLGIFIGAGVLIATVIVLIIVVWEVRRLKRTRPLQFRNALIRDTAAQAVTHDLPPESAPAPAAPEPTADGLAGADDFALPTWPRGVDEKGRPNW